MTFLCRYAAVLLSLFAVGAAADGRSTLTFGPVYFDGKDDYGPDPGAGLANNDWSGARDGSGVKLDFRHEWERIYVAAQGEWLDVRHRSDRIRPVCPSYPIRPPQPPPYQDCSRTTAFFRFDDSYRAAELSIGLRQPMSDAWSMWGQFGYSHQRWSSSGGTARYSPSDQFVEGLGAVSNRQSSWTAGAGLSRRGARLNAELGLLYQPEGYFPSYGALYDNRGVGFSGGGRPCCEQLGSSSLLEGIARADWYFTPRWFGRLEYRPSRQRQYLHAGLGIAF